jgi:hypothetical protein
VALFITQKGVYMRHLLVFFLVLSVSACSTVTGYSPSTAVLLSVEQSDSVELLEKVKSERWASDEWDKYEAASGYKAYAVSVDNNGEIWASGWGDDKISRVLAVQAALYLCRFYSANDFPCKVMEVRGTEHQNWFNERLKRDLPDQIISFGDARKYKAYAAAKGPKVAVIQVPSGGVHWFAKATLDQAREAAMDSCNGSLHESEPYCTELESQN